MCVVFVSQVRHGAGTGLREILKSHGAEGGKVVGSTAEQVGLNHIFRLFVLFFCFFKQLSENQT